MEQKKNVKKNIREDWEKRKQVSGGTRQRVA